jgi:hypothetical protein
VQIVSEFPFANGDAERAIAVSLSAVLTLFAYELLPPNATRPGFLYSANAPGAGKTLLAKIAVIARLGCAPVTFHIEDHDEMRKLLLAEAIAGKSVFFLDNVKGHLSFSALNALMTGHMISGRLLGQSRTIEARHDMTVFITGNGCTISEDDRRRLLVVEFFLREVKAEYRAIRRRLDDAELIELRPKILAALWSLVKSWDRAGQPQGSIIHESFPRWSATIGGILEHNGFLSPCSPVDPSVPVTGGDRDTADMEKLVVLMAKTGTEFRFSELVELCWEHGLFSRIIGDGDAHDGDPSSIEPKDKSRFGKLLARFDGRLFPPNLQFFVHGQRKTRSYQAVRMPTKP